ncbi:glutamate racemase [Ruminiclostridium sufflavum DSM 19573]|uniref:Glutamate racemase n=1 Tax=Ruminiclostridium sufflavum DSM 19573 TaxID=1121337 RepID=A0A318XIU7_9FIRM|nr:glutamate racemase [Ruminiclostridium sufflavum]PYG87150.1 glutamate racemase [Ruminiclostridium sufflavum DSM 19573]
MNTSGNSIGFLDSGFGGITVLSEALKQLPNENYLYYADIEHVPYGTKTKGEVRSYIFEAVEFLVRQGIKALVVACNTATSIAVRDLRSMYPFPIVGMEPAVKPAVQNGNGKRVLVLATPLTLREEKFHNLVQRVDTEHVVDYLAFPELVELAEQMVFDHDKVIPVIKNKLSAYDISSYKTFVLGCTHFPLYKKVFKEVLPEYIDIIDGSSGTVKYLNHLLEEKNILNTQKDSGKIKYFDSGKPVDNPQRLNIFNRIITEL